MDKPMPDKAHCPICKKEAELLDEAELRSFVGVTKGYNCPNPKHGRFTVSDHVLKRQDLMKRPPGDWERALRCARKSGQPGGLTPCITEHHFL